MEDLMLKSIRDTLSYKYWWIYLTVGVTTIFVGFLCLIVPNSNSRLKEIAYFCIGGFLIHDICDIIFSVSNKVVITGWWWQVIKAVIGIAISLLIFSLSANNLTLGIIYFIGFWFLVHSIFFIGELFDLKYKVPDGLELILILSLTEILLSLLYLIFATFYNEVLLLFLLFLIFGIVRFMLGLKYFYWNKEVIKTVS